MQPEDILLVTELSRLGRSLLEVMSILHTLMEKEVKVFTTKERYELGNNISSKVLAFAFSLSAEIEPVDLERRSLKFGVRYMNGGRYPSNFWSSSYRLIVADVPRAPINSLNPGERGEGPRMTSSVNRTR